MTGEQTRLEAFCETDRAIDEQTMMEMLLWLAQYKKEVMCSSPKGEVFIKDILYWIGRTIHEDYRFAGGFEKFIHDLGAWLKLKNNEINIHNPMF